MRRQGWSSACGPWADRDVPEHEVTQPLLTAGRDFSSPNRAPSCPIVSVQVVWAQKARASLCQQPVGTARAKMGGSLW